MFYNRLQLTNNNLDIEYPVVFNFKSFSILMSLRFFISWMVFLMLNVYGSGMNI
jgi:hypothetical protein